MLLEKKQVRYGIQIWIFYKFYLVKRVFFLVSGDIVIQNER